MCLYNGHSPKDIFFFHDFMQIRFTVVLQNRLHPAYSTIKYTVQICSICKTDTAKTHTKSESGKTSRFKQYLLGRGLKTVKKRKSRYYLQAV